MPRGRLRTTRRRRESERVIMWGKEMEREREREETDSREGEEKDE